MPTFEKLKIDVVNDGEIRLFKARYTEAKIKAKLDKRFANIANTLYAFMVKEY